MFDGQSRNVYNIELPISTVNEVVEWFETMSSKGILVDSLIELVNERLKSGIHLESSFCSTGNTNEVSYSQVNASLSQDDFFDSLYDWQGSSSAAFKEEKKVKKKMLYV